MTIALTADHPGKAEYERLRLALWPMPEQDNRSDIEAQLADPAWAVFLEVDETGSGVGFLEVRLRNYAEGAERSPVPYVEGWYVEPEIRRRGVGRMLMFAAEEWARAQGYGELASDTHVDNRESLNAHRRLGFEETDRIVCLLKRL